MRHTRHRRTSDCGEAAKRAARRACADAASHGHPLGLAKLIQPATGKLSRCQPICAALEQLQDLASVERARSEVEQRCASRFSGPQVCVEANRAPQRRLERSPRVALFTNCASCIELRGDGFAMTEPFSKLCPCGPVGDFPDFAQQIVGKRHAQTRSTGL